jgi:hypothetical protein
MRGNRFYRTYDAAHNAKNYRRKPFDAYTCKRAFGSVFFAALRRYCKNARRAVYASRRGNYWDFWRNIFYVFAYAKQKELGDVVV